LLLIVAWNMSQENKENNGNIDDPDNKKRD
jgi:hypothetical protein